MTISASTRVLMLLENNPYPQDCRVRRECKALLSAGYQVSVIAPAEPDQPRREIVEGVEVYRYAAPRGGKGVLGYLWEYGYSLIASFFISLRLWMGRGFDVIHAANPPDVFPPLVVFYKLFGKRFVFDHHDISPELYAARFGSGHNRMVYHALVLAEKLSCRLADLVIATNQSYKLIEMQRDKVPESRIRIVRNAPETDRFRLVDPDPELRARAGFILGYAGVMGYQDGLDYLLRSLHHLAYELGRTDFYCVLIGGRGDARPSLIKLATELQLDNFVKFTGWVSDEDYVRYLSSADICVDPDPSNSFNDRCSMNKMVEYMALGKPIVAFNLPEHRFTAREAALYVPDNDERKFASALAELMDDEPRRLAMGAAGQERFQAVLSWDYSVKELLKGYAQLSPCAKGHESAVRLNEK